MSETTHNRPVFLPPEGAPKVMAAIVGVKRDIEQIPKSGRNKEHNYSYVESTVLTAKIQDAMVKNRLVLSPREVGRSVVGGILFIKFEYDAYCEEQAVLNIASFTGASRFEFRKGTHDDKSATKCLTSSLKAIELALFKIPADVDDIERDRPDFAPSPDDDPRAGSHDDRRAGADGPRDDPPHNGAASHDERGADRSDGEPENEPLDHDTRGFRNRLRDAFTKAEADRVWLSGAAMLDACSDQIFNLLRDDYQSRWDSVPPPLP